MIVSIFYMFYEPKNNNKIKKNIFIKAISIY